MAFFRRFILGIAILVAVLSGNAPGATTGFKFESTVLYQPDDVLRSRVRSMEDLTNYINRIDTACTAYFASEKAPERLDIVVGVKPNGRVRVWVISSRRTPQDQALVVLRGKLETIAPCPVHTGPIAFALRCTIAGGSGNRGDDLPMPTEWRKATADEKLSVPDGIFSKIWRD